MTMNVVSGQRLRESLLVTLLPLTTHLLLNVDD